MSPASLRAELHRVIVSGLEKLRALEYAHEFADSQMLAAKMDAVEAFEEIEDDEWAPDPAEIEAACAEIQAAWNDDEREQRWRFRLDSLTKARERGMRHYWAHREEIRTERRDRRQDPEWRAKQTEYNRRYRERHAAAFKERAAARRGKVNEQRRARRAKNHDQFLAETRAYRERNREALNAQNREYKRARRERERCQYATVRSEQMSASA